MSEPMTHIQARYMSGDEVRLVPCSTINDVRVDIAGRHDKFAPDVTVLSNDYGIVFTDDDAAPPPKVAIVINEELYDDARWHTAVIAHAKAHDVSGVRRAMEKVERFGYGSGVDFCNKVLWRLLFRKGTAVGVRCVSVFIECAADVNYVEQYQSDSVLGLCAHLGRVEVAEMLISARADVNRADEFGHTVLLVAAWAGHAEVAQMLICADADMNYVTNLGFTALMYSHAEVARMLIAAAASVNHADSNGCTALMHFAEAGKTEVVQLLLSAAANINHANGMNRTPLILSAYGGHVKIAQMLISAAADVNHADAGNQTALTRSSDKGHAEVVQALISAAADINDADAENRTPLMIATTRGHAEVVQILTEAQEYTRWPLYSGALVHAHKQLCARKTFK